MAKIGDEVEVIKPSHISGELGIIKEIDYGNDDTAYGSGGYERYKLEIKGEVYKQYIPASWVKPVSNVQRNEEFISTFKIEDKVEIVTGRFKGKHGIVRAVTHSLKDYTFDDGSTTHYFLTIENEVITESFTSDDIKEAYLVVMFLTGLSKDAPIEFKGVFDSRLKALNTFLTEESKNLPHSCIKLGEKLTVGASPTETKLNIVVNEENSTNSSKYGTLNFINVQLNSIFSFEDIISQVESR